MLAKRGGPPPWTVWGIVLAFVIAFLLFLPFVVFGIKQWRAKRAGARVEGQSDLEKQHQQMMYQQQQQQQRAAARGEYFVNLRGEKAQTMKRMDSKASFWSTTDTLAVGLVTRPEKVALPLPTSHNCRQTTLERVPVSELDGFGSAGDIAAHHRRPASPATTYACNYDADADDDNEKVHSKRAHAANQSHQGATTTNRAAPRSDSRLSVARPFSVLSLASSMGWMDRPGSSLNNNNNNTNTRAPTPITAIHVTVEVETDRVKEPDSDEEEYDDDDKTVAHSRLSHAFAFNVSDKGEKKTTTTTTTVQSYAPRLPSMFLDTDFQLEGFNLGEKV